MSYAHYRPEGLSFSFSFMRLVLRITHLPRIVVKNLPGPQLSEQNKTSTERTLTDSISSYPSGGFLVRVVRILGMVGDGAESTAGPWE